MSWNYADYEYHVSMALLVCAMAGMGATLTVRDFQQVFRSPVAMILTVVVQVLITPWLALGIAWLFALPPGIGIGLLLVSALPGGLFSNLLAYLGRGNVALSVAATAVCSLGCLLTTTFVLQTYAAAQLPDDFRMPAGRILLDIGCGLLLPLVFGMLLRRWFPEQRLRIGNYCINASLVLLAVIVIGALTSGRIQVGQYGWRTPVALMLFGVASLWAAYAACLLLRQSLADCFTVGIEVVVRNAHLGVLLKAALFPVDAAGGNELGDGVLFVVLFYGAGSLLISGIEVYAHRQQTGLLFGRRRWRQHA